jgi:hypothetical protein
VLTPSELMKKLSWMLEKAEPLQRGEMEMKRE